MKFNKLSLSDIIVMIVKKRKDQYRQDMTIRKEALYKISDFVG